MPQPTLRFRFFALDELECVAGGAVHRDINEMLGPRPVPLTPSERERSFDAAVKQENDAIDRGLEIDAARREGPKPEQARELDRQEEDVNRQWNEGNFREEALRSEDDLYRSQTPAEAPLEDGPENFEPYGVDENGADTYLV
jgi:hypothetical protein